MEILKYLNIHGKLRSCTFLPVFQFKGTGGKGGDDQVKFTFQCQQIKLYKPCATR